MLYYYLKEYKVLLTQLFTDSSSLYNIRKNQLNESLTQILTKCRDRERHLTKVYQINTHFMLRYTYCNTKPFAIPFFRKFVLLDGAADGIRFIPIIG